MATNKSSQGVQGVEWEGSRSRALSRLRDFTPEASLYATRRNYALSGNPGVSRLSPYLRHRLISEEEVIASVTSVVDFSDAEKFIQEVVWRTYWKGALRLNPALWYSFEKGCKELEAVAPTAHWAPLYEAAKAGLTNLPYFNEWIAELRSTGYLHNHIRMWFASIWIFTFKIPWQLGAAFMYHHLLDGDPASNTLSWRWVAGLHTKGKTYLARADNIAKYSEGRWNPKAEELAAEAFRVEDDLVAGLPNDLAIPEPRDTSRPGLVVTTDDLSIENALDTRIYESVCVYARVGPEETSLKREFLQRATEDLRARLAAVRGEAVIPLATSLPELAAWQESQRLGGVFIVAPHIGPFSQPLSDATSSFASTGIPVGSLERAWDRELFPLCDKGFFTLWERFKRRWEKREQLAGASVRRRSKTV